MHSLDIHPAVRIVVFLVAGAYIAKGQVLDLAAAAVAITVLYLLLSNASLGPALGMLKRMRWFFLSILVVYFWFTPGQQLFGGELGGYGVLVPTVEGLEQGMLRGAALILFVLGVNLLLQTTPRDLLIAGIRWLARPFALNSAFHDKLSVRIALTLEAVTTVQPMVRATATGQADAAVRPLDRIGRAAAGLVNRVLDRARQSPCVPIELPAHGRPPVWQWALPVLLGVGFWWL